MQRHRLIPEHARESLSEFLARGIPKAALDISHDQTANRVTNGHAGSALPRLWLDCPLSLAWYGRVLNKVRGAAPVAVPPQFDGMIHYRHTGARAHRPGG